MKRKRILVIINPRAGKNLAKVTDIFPVLAAADWKTDTAIKEYGRHAIRLAAKGAKARYDLIIGYGGDGTLGQIVNGVLNVKDNKSAVGLIPGGTANLWASEVGVPVEPVKATLSVINSKVRQVDVGHVSVSSDNYWWARLAKLQIVAEMPNAQNQFWEASETARVAALHSVALSGIRAAIGSDLPSGAAGRDFIPVGSTGYYVHIYTSNDRLNPTMSKVNTMPAAHRGQ